jgi:hypothetical protein
MLNVLLLSIETTCTEFHLSFSLDSSGHPLIVFAGGLPRSNYAAKHTISCLHEKEYPTERTQHVTFDFTTSVIDFFIIDHVHSNTGKISKCQQSLVDELFFF